MRRNWLMYSCHCEENFQTYKIWKLKHGNGNKLHGNNTFSSQFFNASKRQNILRKSINTISSTKAQKLVQICATRWVDRHESVSTFSNLQFTVVEALAEISAWPDRETSSRALQLLSTIRQSEFCIALLVLKNVFEYSVVLCKVKEKKVDKPS